MTAVLQYLDDLHLSHLLTRDDLTVDDVASLPEDLRYELLGGRLVLLPTPFHIHQYISHRVVSALELNAPAGVVVNIETSIAVDNENEPRADAAVILLEGAGRTPVFADDVLLAVEVVSGSSTDKDYKTKADLYDQAEIPWYWVIDPLGDRVTFTEFARGTDGRYESSASMSGRVELTEPWPVTLDLAAWTAHRDTVNAALRRRGQAGSR